MGMLLGAYTNNKIFSFHEEEWNLSAVDVSEFNHLYIKIFANKNDKFSLKKDCKNCLDRIFKKLFDGVRDDFEKSFISELHKYASILLEHEVTEALKNDNLYEVNEQKKIENLKKNYFFIDELPYEIVDQLLIFLSKSMAELRSRHEMGGDSRNNLTISSYAKMRIPIRILNQYFKKTSILEAISKYMGCQYEVGGLALELSVDNAGWWSDLSQSLPSSKVRYVHLDESIHAPKAIIYMSDVTESNGPTTCYPGIYEMMEITPIQSLIGRVIGYMGSAEDSILKSYYGRENIQEPVSKSENFRRHFMKLPDTLRFNSHIGWDIEANSNCEKLLLNAEKKLLGRAGKFIVFDGAKLFHRGGMVHEGERFALQLIFERRTYAKLSKRFLKDMWLSINE
jgi:hypothetical protein